MPNNPTRWFSLSREGSVGVLDFTAEKMRDRASRKRKTPTLLRPSVSKNANGKIISENRPRNHYRALHFQCPRARRGRAIFAPSRNLIYLVRARTHAYASSRAHTWRDSRQRKISGTESRHLMISTFVTLDVMSFVGRNARRLHKSGLSGVHNTRKGRFWFVSSPGGRDRRALLAYLIIPLRYLAQQRSAMLIRTCTNYFGRY